MAKNNKKKKFYFRDELNDDFAKLKIKPTKIDDNFKYLTENKFYWCFSYFVRLVIVIPILNLLSKIVYRTKVVNKKVLKQVKHKGYFIYSNHTTAFDPINHACLVNLSVYTLIIASIDTFSIKGIKHLVHFLGAIPVPLSPKMYRHFSETIKYHINKGHKVTIYPEAHIWPYYTKIRPFKSVSFRYPVELDAPVIISTTTFKKRRFSKHPQVIITLDGPIYPNKALKFKDQIEDLRNRTYEFMVKRANEFENYNVYDYIKIDE